MDYALEYPSIAARSPASIATACASAGASPGGTRASGSRSSGRAPTWLAATGSVRVPTGRWADPNNLVDYPTGYAAWGLGLQVHQDFVWQQPGLAPRLGALTTGDFFLNTTFGYQAFLPDDKPFRVCEIHQPICPNLDRHVQRHVGDIVEAELTGSVGLLPGCHRLRENVGKWVV